MTAALRQLSPIHLFVKAFFTLFLFDNLFQKWSLIKEIVISLKMLYSNYPLHVPCPIPRGDSFKISRDLTLMIQFHIHDVINRNLFAEKQAKNYDWNILTLLSYNFVFKKTLLKPIEKLFILGRIWCIKP